MLPNAGQILYHQGSKLYRLPGFPLAGQERSADDVAMRHASPLNAVARVLLAAVLFLSAAGFVAASSYQYYASGDLKAPSAGKTEPGLMLMGGGAEVDEAFRWFVAKAGGGHIVVLRASEADDYHDYFLKTLGGVASVETLVFSERSAAYDEKVLAIVRHADGLFIAGGDQSNYVKFWRGTPINEAIDAHVRAGKPIGGTSAGLAILGGYSYGCMDSISLQATDALRNPYNSSVTLIRDFLHMPHLEGLITDSHFMARGRLGRLITFVSRLNAEEGRRIVGCGVDERTALCVEPDGSARVFTEKDGRAWLVFPPAAIGRLSDGAPLEVNGIEVVAAGPSSRVDLKNWEVAEPVQRLSASCRDGQLDLVAHP